MIQRTIKGMITFSGIGLHTGEKVSLAIYPAESNTGIVFVRKDLESKPSIRAEIDSLLDIDKFPRRTSIASGPVHIHTVEHLLSALFGLGIDNVLIEIDGTECPGLDGGSHPYAQALYDVGIVEQKEEKVFFKIKEPVFISTGNAQLIALPCDTFKVSYTLDYPSSPLRAQFASFNVTPDIYLKEIAPSRTFCLEEEVDKLRSLGLGKGSDFQNTVVIGKDGVVENTFRFENEPVRHKISDLIGDLALLGTPLNGHIIGIRSGHALNTRLVKRLKEHFIQEQMAAAIAFDGEIREGSSLEIEDIQKIIPHRAPFLLVDRIIEIGERRAVGIKNVSYNEWFFPGHFPGRPVMPGVLIVEAMAQVGGVLMLSKKENRGKLAYFRSIQSKFRKTVKPGDRLVLEVAVDRLKGKVGRIFGKAYVEKKIACEAELMCALVDD